jgi:riboflavin kinase/FMN adenylyltransferase
MRIWNGVAAFPRDTGPVVATIGNYDGVHRGHQLVLARVVDEARRAHARSLLVTFTPHPLEIVAPDRRPRLLQTRRQKLRTLEETRIDDVLLVEFTPEIAAQDGERFFSEVLGPVPLRSVHVGASFRFGRDRSGNVETLADLGRRRGFAVHAHPALLVDGEPVSSTAIRRSLEAGEVERAERLLGRPYEVTGEVVPGEGRGRSLDCPTANVDHDNEIVPRHGVYVTETVALASRFPSVTNVGVRPTFGGRTASVETHLLGFDGDLYYERVAVRFLARLRDEMRFDGAPALADQIARDLAAAESFFQNRRLA